MDNNFRDIFFKFLIFWISEPTIFCNIFFISLLIIDVVFDYLFLIFKKPVQFNNSISLLSTWETFIRPWIIILTSVKYIIFHLFLYCY